MEKTWIADGISRIDVFLREKIPECFEGNNFCVTETGVGKQKADFVTEKGGGKQKTGFVTEKGGGKQAGDSVTEKGGGKQESGFVTEAGAGQKTQVSNSKIRRLIMAGCVCVNGIQCRNPSFEIKQRDKITAVIDKEKFFFEKQPDDIKFELTEKDVLYEDDVIIVVNKPAFFPTEKTIVGDRDNLHEAVKRYLHRNNPTARNVPYAGVMHRLDRETSGVILFSKSRSVNAKIFEMFEKHTARKVYNAVCCLRNEAALRDEFVVDKAIMRVSSSSQACKMGVVSGGQNVCSANRAGGFAGQDTVSAKKGGFVKHDAVSAKKGGSAKDAQPAVTECRGLKKNKSLALIEARPLTGRTHQIRVHLSSEGLPLLGDTLYGGRKAARIMLHAVSLTFPHPVTGEVMTVSSPLPEEFLNLK